MEQQIVLILIIGAISLVNWLIEKSAKLREKRRIESLEQEPPSATSAHLPHPGQLQRANRVEESLREFMETFGLPLPVEPVPTNSQSTPVGLQPPLPPLSDTRQNLDLPSTAPIQHQIPCISRPRSNRWASQLHGRSTIREAMILSEILGSPRAKTLH